MTSLSAPARSESEEARFRPEIEGLRGLAVALVVLYHTGIVAGGFIGVDVFFVISGFLITGLLMREREATGSISFVRFYARRVRRLAPAGLLVLGVTSAAVWLLWSPLDRGAIMTDAAAAVSSVANIRFALSAGGYFAAVSTPSPFLHYWSLSLEEQFYLVWPALMLLATRARRPRRAALVVVLVVTAASLALELFLSGGAANWAFYALPARAWQLGLGGLLALAELQILRLRAGVRGLAAAAGLGAIAAAAFLLTDADSYPSLAALVPTVGAALVIAGGLSLPGRLLALPPLRGLGLISYSLYLWHWPLLVIGGLVAGDGGLELPAKLGLMALAVGLAAATYRFIEQPVRHSRQLLGHNGRTLVAGLTSLILVAGTTTLAAAGSDAAIPGAVANVSATMAPDPTDDPFAGWPPGLTLPAPSAGPVSGPTSGPTKSPLVGPTPRPTLRPTPRPTAWPTLLPPPPGGYPTTIIYAPSLGFASPTSWALDPAVTPSLAGARTDFEKLWSNGCLLGPTGTRPPVCVFGDAAAKFTVAIAGDSHASHWFPALEAIAKHNGWRLVTYVKVSCPIADIEIYYQIEKRDYPECTTWNTNVVAAVKALHPDLLLVSESRWFIPNDRSLNDVTDKAQAYARQIAKFTTAGRVAMIADTGTTTPADIPACLAAHATDIRACETLRSIPFGANLFQLERPVQRLTGIPIIDMSAAICPSATYCQAVLGDHIIYRDYHHFTATFARAMALSLDVAILQVTH
jgi:peptidoglycan/LPS O-acetylase OafA/YrhL